MKILALGRDVPGATDQQFAPHLAAEARRAWELHQAGVIREFSPGHLTRVLLRGPILPRWRAYSAFGPCGVPTKYASGPHAYVRPPSSVSPPARDGPG